ncbi:hypothetical protein CEXT_373191 [Caerostris extrusa]|uniref:Retinol dehydrogenase 13 n=1 Tax=Caerostris extrusa TaxID=172846 RepID=A0AAV4UBQ4_CAEEX|nr:hypothetical protein CEXT_373191 [Caerostris extrusa]
MEAMDICIATIKEISYLVINHPIYSSIGVVVCVFSLLKFYCRLTLGVCDCDAELSGKTVLITGASDGIGKAAAMDLARRKARVLLACRNKGKAERVAQEIRSATGNDNVVVKILDLCSFESVRRCARDVLDTEQKLHVLINNAGITGIGRNRREYTEDGCEKVMQSNHLGHFLLTALLLDLLKKSAPSRIINVSSDAYTFEKLDLNDMRNENVHSDIALYANSKLANILFTKELAHRLSGTGLTVNALHPGCVETNIMDGSEGVFATMTKILFATIAKKLEMDIMVTVEEGAQTTIHVSVDPRLERTTGKYFSDCKEVKLKGSANDRTLAKRLFEISEKIVGESYPQS